MDFTNPNTWVAIASIILVIVTGYYAWAAHQTVVQMQTAREETQAAFVKARKEQIESICILLEQEIDQNYDGAITYWKNVATDKSPHVVAAQRMISMPQPAFNFIARNSLLAQLPIALQPEKIRKVGIFYTKLDKIISINTTLAALNSGRVFDPNIRTRFGQGAVINEEFNRFAPELVLKCQAIFDSLEKPTIP